MMWQGHSTQSAFNNASAVFGGNSAGGALNPPTGNGFQGSVVQGNNSFAPSNPTQQSLFGPANTNSNTQQLGLTSNPPANWPGQTSSFIQPNTFSGSSPNFSTNSNIFTNSSFVPNTASSKEISFGVQSTTFNQNPSSNPNPQNNFANFQTSNPNFSNQNPAFNQTAGGFSSVSSSFGSNPTNSFSASKSFPPANQSNISSRPQNTNFANPQSLTVPFNNSVSQIIKYKSTQIKEENGNVNIANMCAMAECNNKSIEEIRLAEYKIKCNGSSTAGIGNIVNQQLNPVGTGVSNIFSNTASNNRAQTGGSIFNQNLDNKSQGVFPAANTNLGFTANAFPNTNTGFTSFTNTTSGLPSQNTQSTMFNPAPSQTPQPAIMNFTNNNPQTTAPGFSQNSITQPNAPNPTNNFFNQVTQPNVPNPTQNFNSNLTQNNVLNPKPNTHNQISQPNPTNSTSNLSSNNGAFFAQTSAPNPSISLFNNPQPKAGANISAPQVPQNINNNNYKQANYWPIQTDNFISPYKNDYQDPHGLSWLTGTQFQHDPTLTYNKKLLNQKNTEHSSLIERIASSKKNLNYSQTLSNKWKTSQDKFNSTSKTNISLTSHKKSEPFFISKRPSFINLKLELYKDQDENKYFKVPEKVCKTPENEIQVQVVAHTPEPIRLIISVIPTTTVKEIKHHISKRLCEFKDFQLVYKSHVLLESETIVSYRIRENDELTVIYTPEGYKKTTNLPNDNELPVIGSGYYTKPTIMEMAKMSIENLMKIKNFTIENEYGKLVFEGETNVVKLNIAEIIQILHKEVVGYPEESKIAKPCVGQGLNKPAELTLYKFEVPGSKDKAQEKIMKMCEKGKFKFVSYDQENCELVVRIKHF
ncbi:hypothetical protein SteCoe_12506 [Stentor coeruleus]|uniref:Peptidase S59 domain-containing protein n=1 Tax=Stentor coeruleus TaxID=5963 RepID=A0A1R2CAN6_9CILI|nr:hypothetical protein SteCoe_12506 [Stentor coeruleus]